MVITWNQFESFLPLPYNYINFFLINYVYWPFFQYQQYIMSCAEDGLHQLSSLSLSDSERYFLKYQQESDMFWHVVSPLWFLDILVISHLIEVLTAILSQMLRGLIEWMKLQGRIIFISQSRPGLAYRCSVWALYQLSQNSYVDFVPLKGVSAIANGIRRGKNSHTITEVTSMAKCFVNLVLESFKGTNHWWWKLLSWSQMNGLTKICPVAIF